MTDPELAISVLFWIAILTTISTGLVAIFRTLTKPIRHRLNFKPFSCDVCMSFWTSLGTAAAWVTLTDPMVSAVDAIVIPAAAVVGSVGTSYILRRFFQARDPQADSGAAVEPDDQSMPPSDDPPVTM